MKERLYYINPYTKSFSTSVVDRSHDEEGQFYVVLKETAFYPTGGGDNLVILAPSMELK